MKRVTVAAIAALMLACVLPMARAQEAASNSPSPDVVKHDDQASQEIAKLQAQLKELMAQQQQLQEQLQALRDKNAQPVDKAETRRVYSTTTSQVHRKQKTDQGNVTVVPWQDEDPLSQDARKLKDVEEARRVSEERAQAAREQARSMDEQKKAQVEAQRAQVDAQRAKVEALRAAADTERVKAEARREAAMAKHLDKMGEKMNHWAQSEQMQKYQADIKNWENSDEMKRWEQEMETWGQKMEKWGQEMGRRYQQGGEDATEAAPAPEAGSAGSAMPAMPAMPPMPQMPPVPQMPEMPVDMSAGPVHQEQPDLPDGDRTINLQLPERIDLIHLMDLVGKYLNLNYVYDPQQVAGEVTLDGGDRPTGTMQAKDLYALLGKVLAQRGLAMVRGDGNTVRIVTRADAAVSHAVPPVPQTPPGAVNVHVSTPHVVVTPNPTPNVQPTPAMPLPGAAPRMENRQELAVSCGDFVVQSVPAEATLTVGNGIGDVAIEGAEGRDCTVKATARIKSEDREEAERLAKGVVVQVTPVDGRIQVAVRMSEGMTDEQRNKISVNLNIVVPNDANVEARLKVGNLNLTSLQGDVTAAVDVGAIKTWDLQGDVAIRTNVGNIDFATSRDLSAKIQAQAQVGSISSNLPLAITGAAVVHDGNSQGALLGSHASGTLGQGKNKIELAANVGAIQINWKEAPQKHEMF